MTLHYSISKGQLYPMGVTYHKEYLNINISLDDSLGEVGIVLFSNNKEIIRIPFSKEYKIGQIYVIKLCISEAEKYTYLFYQQDELIMDPYARCIKGREKWGKRSDASDQTMGVFSADCMESATDNLQWDKDSQLCIPYEDSIIYSLHVRGFTKDTSSGVKNKGTFEGIIEKIPYFKELGINAIEVMPIYEFDEIIKNKTYSKINPAILEYMPKDKKEWDYRINYWGFADEGNYYFAPKAAYSCDNNPEKSLKNLIFELHKNNIEIIMQMYFGPQCAPDFIAQVLHFWVVNFHVDGFHLFGSRLPMELLGRDLLLKSTKLIAENTMSDCINENGKKVNYRNLGRYNDGFRVNARRFLKGDADLLYAMSCHFRETFENEAVINHITDYRGFSLLDLVSYDRKHNENNGEENRDGSDYNYSWNCGIEGPTRKKAITKLRLSQRKNALCMLFLAKGTPLLLAGDECGHTLRGNNNAYCQDNKINYINWNLTKEEKEMFDFTKQLIAFRKQHPILHSARPFKLMDTISCGYPDLSYHSEQAWIARFENYNHHMGLMYCGLYEKTDHDTDDYIYIAYNMHWIPHELAVPALPSGYKFNKVIMTVEEQVNADKEGECADREITSDIVLENDKQPKSKNKSSLKIELSPRSVVVLVSSKEKEV